VLGKRNRLPIKLTQLPNPSATYRYLRSPDGRFRRILFSNGSRRMLFLGFDALGMPVFSPRSAGA
jgi:hypothetical protein